MNVRYYSGISLLLMILLIRSTPLASFHNDVCRDGSPVPIFYGLNESHSNSWAQCTPDGKAGCVYFLSDNHQDGSLIYKEIDNQDNESEQLITLGSHLEVSVLLYDENLAPHVFVAMSDSLDQTIAHFYKTTEGQWISETIIHFYNEGGLFIYEMSADTGPDGSFHLLILKTRSNPDSEDYYLAFLDSHLYHLSNESSEWESELIHTYDMIYTLDEYTKAMNRQDIRVDSAGNIHVVFGEQIDPFNDTSGILNYATNSSGNWVIEIAANCPPHEDAGWYPSLALDSQDLPHISCCYIDRLSTGSATHAELLYFSRLSDNNWTSDLVATDDDDYYGSDFGNYTGALTHLVIDENDTPHVLFSDIASSHGRSNYFNLGNIRYAVLNEDTWEITKIYDQPLPDGRYNATEMYANCLLISESADKIQLLGQEVIITNDSTYTFNLIHRVIQESTHEYDFAVIAPDKEISLKIYPSPFYAAQSDRSNSTNISFNLIKESTVKLQIFNLKGQLIKTLSDGRKEAGNHTFIWDGKDADNTFTGSGFFLIKLSADNQTQLKKVLVIK